MPNFFRSIFKPNSQRSNGHDEDANSVTRVLTPSQIDLLASPINGGEQRGLADRDDRGDLNILAKRLLQRIEGSEDRAETMRGLLEVLRETQLRSGGSGTSHFSELEDLKTIIPFPIEPEIISTDTRGPRSFSTTRGGSSTGRSWVDERPKVQGLSRKVRFPILNQSGLGDSMRASSASSSLRTATDSRASSIPGPQNDLELSRDRTSNYWARAEGEKVIEECSAAQNAATKLLKNALLCGDNQIEYLIDRCIKLLDAQRRELEDIFVYLERGQYPALRTLGQLYEKLASGLKDVMNMKVTEVSQTLTTLVTVLEEGPDYLIDTLILELITHHAETIDPNLGFQMRQVMNRAIAAESNLLVFRRAAESVLALAVALPEQALDDEMARASYRIIGLLVKQLRLRVDNQDTSTIASIPPNPATFSRASSLMTPLAADGGTYTPGLSTVPSSVVETPGASTPIIPLSGSVTPTGEFTPYNASDLTRDFGTGPMTTPAQTLPPSINASNIGTPAEPIPPNSTSKIPTPATPTSPAISEESSASELSIFEYDGHFLTHSALNLVLAQEAQMMADSSGQYRGQVSWDAVRNAWIPKWAVKLKPEDLAEGELPSTNPADYEVRQEDAWGNKIGWREDGRMYYLEDPVFDKLS